MGVSSIGIVLKIRCKTKCDKTLPAGKVYMQHQENAGLVAPAGEYWRFNICKQPKPSTLNLQIDKICTKLRDMSDDLLKLLCCSRNKHLSCGRGLFYNNSCGTSTNGEWLLIINVLSLTLIVKATTTRLSIVHSQTRKNNWRQLAIHSNTSVLGDGSRSSEEWLATSDADALLSLSGLSSTAACAGLPIHPR